MPSFQFGQDSAQGFLSRTLFIFAHRYNILICSLISKFLLLFYILRAYSRPLPQHISSKFFIDIPLASNSNTLDRQY